LTAAASTARTWGCRLSSMTTSAPAPAAASASAAQLHSTSIFTLKPHRARAAATADGMLPVAAMWLSFSMTCGNSVSWTQAGREEGQSECLAMELRSMRCVSTPPMSSPYLQQQSHSQAAAGGSAQLTCRPVAVPVLLCACLQRGPSTRPLKPLRRIAPPAWRRRCSAPSAPARCARL